jgi:hypothetical protein
MDGLPSMSCSSLATDPSKVNSSFDLDRSSTGTGGALLPLPLPPLLPPLPLLPLPLLPLPPPLPPLPPLLGTSTFRPLVAGESRGECALGKHDEDEGRDLLCRACRLRSSASCISRFFEGDSPTRCPATKLLVARKADFGVNGSACGSERGSK